MTYILQTLNRMGYEDGSLCDDAMSKDILNTRFTAGYPVIRGITLSPNTIILYVGPDWFVSKVQDKIGTEITVHHVKWVTRVITWSGPFTDLIGL